MKGTYFHKKPHVGIGMIGHAGHGKTTLSAAILAVQAKRGMAEVRSYGEIAKGGIIRDGSKIVTVAAAHMEFETEQRHYSLVDCPGRTDFVKNMVTGASQVDGGILVVSAADGPMPQTREHLFLAHQMGVRGIVVFLNKVDQIGDRALLDLVESEIRDLLTKNKFDGANAKVVRGSAIAGLEGKPDGEKTIRELLTAIDAGIAEPPRAIDLPFLMPVEDVFSIAGRGIVVTGRIERGLVRLNDRVDIVGLRDTSKTAVVVGIEMFRKLLDQGRAGDHVGLLLHNVGMGEIERGQVIAVPNSIAPQRRAIAEIYMLSKEEGGRHTPFFDGYQPQFFFRTADIAGVLRLPDGVRMIMPGDNVSAEIELLKPVAIEQFQRFAIRDGERTIGAGKIIDIVDVHPRMASPRRRLGTAPGRKGTVRILAGAAVPPAARVANAHLTAGLDGRPLLVDAQKPLDRGTLFGLNVQIGSPDPRSLIARSPPIEPLLPELKAQESGWQVEVVVFSKNCDLDGKSSLPLFLPKTGDSPWVSFRFRTPVEGKEACLRFSIFYRNHLLQSFDLVAPLVGADALGTKITITCDYSATDSFANLDSIKPRAFCLGLNDNDRAGSHRLLVKGTKLDKVIDLDEALLERITGEFREILCSSVQGPDGSSVYPLNPDEKTRPQFDDTIRRLAKLGGDMFQALFNQHQTEIFSLMNAAPDLPIQVVRHKVSHDYPWSIVYDFRVPHAEAGTAKPRVCLGAADPHPCGCTRALAHAASSFCINGFWGVRRLVEQRIGELHGESSESSDIKTGPDSPIFFLVVDGEDQITNELHRELESIFPERVELLAKGQNPLERLWSQPDRPGILVIFGHSEKIPGQADNVRFSLPAGDGWLYPEDVTDKALDRNALLENPSPLVILMTCESGAVKLAQLNSFTQAFVGAGASGVIGTETEIFAGYAQYFVGCLAKQLAKEGSVGAAVHSFLRERTAAGDPRGFGFTYIGSADLNLVLSS